jgi:hypothetical protein
LAPTRTPRATGLSHAGPSPERRAVQSQSIG